MFGELTDHHEWPKFLAWLETKVDNHRDLVVRAAERSDADEVRRKSGGHTALLLLYKELTDGKES